MLISLFSDLHIEFNDYKYQLPHTRAKVYILAGDIGNGLRGIQWCIDQSIKLNKRIIVVLGNHDYYYNDFTLYIKAKELCEGTRVHILEKDIITLDNIKFIGCTWWTDYLAHGEIGKSLAMRTASDFMNDHRLIRRYPLEKYAFTPDDALEIHEISQEWLNKELQSTGKKVVITHHSPTHFGIGPRYRGDAMSPAFFNDAEGFILERQPDLWCFGHTHFNTDIMIGKTRVISNQLGYSKEGVIGFNPKLLLEV